MSELFSFSEALFLKLILAVVIIDLMLVWGEMVFPCSDARLCGVVFEMGLGCLWVRFVLFFLLTLYRLGEVMLDCVWSALCLYLWRLSEDGLVVDGVV